MWEFQVPELSSKFQGSRFQVDEPGTGNRELLAYERSAKLVEPVTGEDFGRGNPKYFPISPFAH